MVEPEPHDGSRSLTLCGMEPGRRVAAGTDVVQWNALEELDLLLCDASDVPWAELRSLRVLKLAHVKGTVTLYGLPELRVLLLHPGSGVSANSLRWPAPCPKLAELHVYGASAADRRAYRALEYVLPRLRVYCSVDPFG